MLEKNWTEKKTSKTINQKELIPRRDRSPHAIRCPTVPHQFAEEE